MENSSKRRTWEEEIYWQDFYFAHFSVTLPTDFHHQIKNKEKLSKGYANTSRNRKKNPAKSVYARDCSDESDDEEETDGSSDEDNSFSKEFIATPNKVAAARERDLRERKHNVVKQTSQKKSSGIYQFYYKSNRRPVTYQEVENALNKAMEASKCCINPFYVVMRPSCVYKRFFMTIPAAWKPSNVFSRNQEVILKVKKKTWVCKITFNVAAVGFERGWKDFAVDNFCACSYLLTQQMEDMSLTLAYSEWFQKWFFQL